MIRNAWVPVTDTRQYDAFGLLTGSSGSTPTPFGFAGGWGYQQDSTGLQLLGHRYYDPSTGRFLTRDPIKDGRNWYGYCENNPLKFVDPAGLVSICGFEFTVETIGDGLAVSGAALLTVVSNTAVEGMKFWAPGARPWIEHWCGWDGGAYKERAGFKGSTVCWDIAGQALETAVGAKGAGVFKGVKGAAGSADTLVPVTRWGRQGLQPGDWVMKGKATRLNYILSGKWQPSWLPGGNRLGRFKDAETSKVKFDLKERV